MLVPVLLLALRPHRQVVLVAVVRLHPRRPLHQEDRQEEEGEEQEDQEGERRRHRRRHHRRQEDRHRRVVRPHRPLRQQVEEEGTRWLGIER